MPSQPCIARKSYENYIHTEKKGNRKLVAQDPIKRHRKAVARRVIKEIRAGTVCSKCGAQPIEWHDPTGGHTLKPNSMVSSMVGKGLRLETIQAEIARCIPLCARCHRLVHRPLRTRSQVLSWAEWYNSGPYSLEDVGLHFGVSTNMVYRDFVRCGVKRKPSTRKKRQ